MNEIENDGKLRSDIRRLKKELKNVPVVENIDYGSSEPLSEWLKYDNEKNEYGTGFLNTNGFIYGFIYLIILPNGSFYIGKHKFSAHTNSYCGSGKLIEKYLRKNCNNKKGIKRIIVKKCDNNKELKLYEEFFIKKFGAVKNERFLNLIKGNASEFEEKNTNPVVIKSWDGRKKIFKNIFDTAENISEFLNIKNIKFSISRLKNWIEGITMVYEKYMKDCYYENYSVEEIEKIRKKREKLREGERIVIILADHVLQKGWDKKLEFSNAGYASYVLKSLNIKIRNAVLIKNAKGESLGYEKWDWVENVYLKEFENKLDELEKLRDRIRNSVENWRKNRHKHRSEAYREEARVRMKEVANRPETKKKKAVAIRKNADDPVWRKKVSVGKKKSLKDPAKRAVLMKHLETVHENKRKSITVHFKNGNVETFAKAENLAKHFGVNKTLVDSWFRSNEKRIIYSFRQEKYNIDFMEYDGRIIK